MTHSSKRVGEPAIHRARPARKARLMHNDNVTESSGPPYLG